MSLPVQVQAQLRTTSLSSQLPAQWEPPTNPENPSPDNREGGGIRGNGCNIPAHQKLIPLVPRSGIGTTTTDYPTLFWYMPVNTASAVEFVLRDANDQELYHVKYNLAKSEQGVVGAPGIMSLTIPSSVNLAPLKTGQTYYWGLALICNGADNLPDYSSSPFIQGGIERVELSPTMALGLQHATPQDAVVLYATNRDWYETLRSLVELRRHFPNDPEVAQAWEKLLQSVDLEGVSQAPDWTHSAQPE